MSSFGKAFWDPSSEDMTTITVSQQPVRSTRGQYQFSVTEITTTFCVICRNCYTAGENSPITWGTDVRHRCRYLISNFLSYHIWGQLPWAKCNDCNKNGIG